LPAPSAACPQTAVAGSDGAIYAITHDGDLLYRQLGYATGTANWAPWSGRRIGNGWISARWSRTR
jgi:hypothetical protein